MRGFVDTQRITAFLRALGAEADCEVRLYLTGGATAVLLGWRPSTIDIDILLVPEVDRLFRAIPKLKEDLGINVELASPADFIPVAPGWEDRSRFVGQEGRLAIYHFDLYAQALAKTERGHAQDIADVEEMIRRGLLELDRLRAAFEQIEPNLYRFPAIDPRSFRRTLEKLLDRPG